MQFIILWLKFHLYLHSKLMFFQERFALEVSDDYIKKALGKRWRDNKSTLKKQYFKKDISLEEKLRNVPPGMLKYQWENAVRFWNSKKGEVLRISKLLYIVFTIYVIIILLCRTVSELEQAVGKNKNSRTRQGREVLLLQLRPRYYEFINSFKY